jgi:DNA-binding response OmpR family regulator
VQITSHIAVVEDEPDILDLVSLHLKKERLTVRGFLNGSSFLRSLETDPPALLVLDLMLPDMPGFEICRCLRSKVQYQNISIIMLTARSEETDRVLGLELGADDYVVKPFSPRELTARVKAVLRRTVNKSAPEGADIVTIGQSLPAGKIVRIDPDKYEVTVGTQKLDLTTTEFRILHLLASKVGWVFSRDRILTHLWGNDKMVLDRTIDVHIKHLRTKMGEAGRLIKNLRGVGYKVEDETEN